MKNSVAANAANKGKIWLKRELSPYRGTIVFLAFLSATVTLLSLSFAYLVRYLINSASQGKQAKLLAFSAVVLGVLL